MSPGGSRPDPEASGGSLLVFGDFELDEGALTLLRRGEPVEIATRPLELLRFLCRNRHRLVTKDELLDQVWGDIAVSEASVFTALREIRRALGDDGKEQRFIQTRRGHGYQFVADVELRERGTGASQRRDFVGRGAPLASLRRCWEECRAGRGGIVLLAGEPGIGKTRCLEEFASELPEVCRASCWEGEGAPPYWPWIQLVRELCGSDAELAAWAGDSPIARLLAGSESEAAQGPGRVRPDARFRLFDAVRELLARASAGKPRALIVEDLHWADPSSLQLLEFLSHEAGQRAWLLLGSYRDSEALPPHPLNQTLGLIRRQPGVSVERLQGLDERAVGQLMQHLSGSAPSEPTLRETHRRTGGNPLWILALFGLRGGPPDEALSRSQAPVREILEGLAGRLSPQTRHLLECAAVIGAEASLARLAEVSELDEAAIQPLVAEAQRAGFLVAGRAGRVRFVHALIQEVCYQSLPGASAAALHGRVGRVLAAFHGGDPGPHLAEIARHHDKTAAWGGAAEALEYSRRAGDWAMRVLAFDEAAAHRARARDALDHLPGAGERERCDLLLGEAEALACGGRLAESIAACRPAAEIARRLGDGERLARAAIGTVGRLLPMGVLDGRDVELLEEALRGVRADALALRAELLLRLAAHASAAGEPETAAALMADAERLAAESGDAAVQVLVLRIQAYNRAGGVDPQVRLDAAADAFERAEASGDHEAAALALFLGITGRLVTGEIREADRSAEILQRRVERQRLLQVEPFLCGYRATRALMRGEFAEAERLAVETAALGGRVSSPVAALYFGVPQLAQLRRAQGRSGEIAPLFVEAQTRFPDQVAFIAPLALLLAEAGEQEEARTLFRRAEAMGFETLPIDANRLALLTMFAETAGLLGEQQAAPALYELALPQADRFAAAGHAQAVLGPMSTALGVLAGLAGWDDQADRYFAAALEATERIESPPLGARARLYWARALAGRRKRDKARIGQLLWEALAVARPLGMHGLVDAAEALRDEVGARQARRGRR